MLPCTHENIHYYLRQYPLPGGSVMWRRALAIICGAVALPAAGQQTPAPAIQTQSWIARSDFYTLQLMARAGLYSPTWKTLALHLIGH
jgi:hypothetical protein